MHGPSKAVERFPASSEPRTRTIQPTASLGSFPVLPQSLRFFAGETVSLFEDEVMVPASVDGVVWSFPSAHVIVPERLDFKFTATLPGVMMSIAG
jgi:hypothetical protein